MGFLLALIVVIGVIWLATKGIGLLIGVIIAGIVGWAASSIMGGDGAGTLGNVLLGLVGGLIGPVLLSLINIDPDQMILGGIISSLIGAVAVIAIARVLGFRSFAK